MNMLRKQIGLALATALALAVAAPAWPNMGEEESDSNDPNFTNGRKAVESQDWNKAVDLLTTAVQADPKNADAHNLLGYAYRKKGAFAAAFEHYDAALKLNPKHKHAHEYVGEAYLLTDDLPKAELHLAALQKICSPIPCEEYKELKRAVDEYKKKKK